MTRRVYVSTYRKYACGSLKGKWLDFDDYNDLDDFMEACEDLHADEDDPEFMYQDFDGVPKAMVSEGWISPNLYDYFDTVDNSHLDEEVFVAAAEVDIEYDDVGDRYRGEADSHAEFSRHWYYQVCDETTLGVLVNYVDWDAVWDGELRHDFVEQSGHYFYNN